MLVELGVTENADFNDVTSYALITLVSEEDVEGAMLGVSSDDSVKVWLNGEEVHNTQSTADAAAQTPSKIRSLLTL